MDSLVRRHKKNITTRLMEKSRNEICGEPWSPTQFFLRRTAGTSFSWLCCTLLSFRIKLSLIKRIIVHCKITKTLTLWKFNKISNTIYTNQVYITVCIFTNFLTLWNLIKYRTTRMLTCNKMLTTNVPVLTVTFFLLPRHPVGKKNPSCKQDHSIRYKTQMKDWSSFISWPLSHA